MNAFMYATHAIHCIVMHCNIVYVVNAYLRAHVRKPLRMFSIVFGYVCVCTWQDVCAYACACV